MRYSYREALIITLRNIKYKKNEKPFFRIISYNSRSSAI